MGRWETPSVIPGPQWAFASCRSGDLGIRCWAERQSITALSYLQASPWWETSVCHFWLAHVSFTFCVVLAGQCHSCPWPPLLWEPLAGSLPLSLHCHSHCCSSVHVTPSATLLMIRIKSRQGRSLKKSLYSTFCLSARGQCRRLSPSSSQSELSSLLIYPEGVVTRVSTPIMAVPHPNEGLGLHQAQVSWATRKYSPFCPGWKWLQDYLEFTDAYGGKKAGASWVQGLTPIILAPWGLRSGGLSLRPAWANSLWDPISKISRTKCTGGVVQEVEWLFCKHKVLVQTPVSLEKTKTKIAGTRCLLG
jgi:hypothetical protein